MTSPVSIAPDWPAPAHVKTVSTTRIGGCSLTPYDSFNLALHTDDETDRVLRNRVVLREYFHLPAEPVWLNQVHGNQVVLLENLPGPSVTIDADASLTRQAGRVCAVMTADCLPVFLSDREGSVVAIAHAGWKGLLAGVITETVEAMAVEPGEVLVWLGPAIGEQAFIVGGEVRQAFEEKDARYLAAFRPESENHWLCDIYQLARIELSMLGIEHVYGGGLCTYTDEKQFYSYRRDGAETGRMAHCIWIEPH